MRTSRPWPLAALALAALSVACQVPPATSSPAPTATTGPLSSAPAAFVLANPTGLVALDKNGAVVRRFDVPRDTFPSGPAVHPDGRQLAFALTRIGSSGFGSDILVVNLDGTGLRALVTHEQDNVFYAGPVFDPSGRYVYFGRRAGIVQNGTSVTDDGIERLDLVSNGRTRILSDAADVAISPDGKTLVFAHLVKGQVDALWTANPDGSQARPLLTVKDRFLYLQTPRFAPVGCQVVFSGAGHTTSRGAAGQRQAHLGIPSELYLVPCDGSRIDTLAQTLDDVTPAWSPDAMHVAYVVGGGLYALAIASKDTTRIAENDAFTYGDLVWLR